MDLDLQNRIALITGSSRGIGKSIALTLNDEGCTVILNGRNIKNLKSSVKDFHTNLSFFTYDVTDPISCKKMVKQIVKKFGGLDILICNVGSGKSVPSGTEQKKDWLNMFEKNFLSTTNMIEASKNELEKSHGCVICISSIAGMERTNAPTSYACSKAALNSYVHSICKPLAKRNIRINAVSPGNIMFEGSTWEEKLSKKPLEVKKMLKNDVPLNRFGTPEEVSHLVSFLVSKKASFITGAIFTIDGGQTHS